ncbi:MAG TPA: hypothetical protein VM939_03360 [Gemmatimonadaceae bacterium]|nr:hypothetical protein [Gemmatimonadaceae bacterium]
MPVDRTDLPAVDPETDDSGPLPPENPSWPLAPVLTFPTADRVDTDEGPAFSRDRMSHQHIISARFFADAVQEIESGDREAVTQDDRLKHRAFVSAAVLSAASFLEASINELYLELQKLSQSSQPQLRRELAMLPRVWPQIVSSPVLHKYQLALSVADGDQYNESKAPFLDADSLVHLRDALLSYRPDWEDRRGRHRTLEKRLQAKFPQNALVSEHAPWFPDRCLGAGCAKWAVRTVELFSDDFSHRMAIPSRPLSG